MRRISLSLRLVLIVAGAMFLLQVIAIGVQVSRDDGFTLGGIRPSFARQVAGLTRLFDRLPPVRQRIAVEFLNEGRFGIRLEDALPEEPPPGPLLGFTANAVAARIAEEGIAPERIAVNYVPNLETDTQRGPLQRLFGKHLRIAIALDNGRYLVIDPSSEVDSYVYGNILAVAAGILALGILAVAVVAVLRETRPLAALAGNVEAFAKSAVPHELKEEGAPELRSLIRATNRMQHEIAALLRNRALILAGMSHDLRTQVTRLRLRLELLPPSEARERAIADVEDMQALIEESLEFAAATSAADGGSADVSAVLDRLRSERGAAMRWPGAPPTLLAIGETPLRRLLDNLVGNAIAYGEQAEVSLSRRGGRAVIEVADRGPGIPASERQAIFEPFYRLEASRSRAHGGSGIGLAIVQQIVDRHGGSIEVGNRPGGGALFTVTLPLA